MSKHLSRKFIAMLVAALAAFLLQWYGKLDASGTSYVWIVNATVGAYIAGNVIARKQGKEE